MVILIMAMRQITTDSLDRALGLLGELIAARGHSLQHFVVCGGSSLLALGLVKRATTRDVDILARVGPDGLVTPRPLPHWLLDAAAEVGKQLDLPEEWLNDRVARRDPVPVWVSRGSRTAAFVPRIRPLSAHQFYQPTRSDFSKTPRGRGSRRRAPFAGPVGSRTHGGRIARRGQM